jgi:hypothetical protein
MPNSTDDPKADELARRQAVENLAEEVMEICRHCASLPLLDTRSADEILEYDDRGLPP